MYLCLCKGITEDQVKEQLHRHPKLPFQEVMKRMGIGKDCGTCLQRAFEMTLLKTQKPASPKQD